MQIKKLNRFYLTFIILILSIIGLVIYALYNKAQVEKCAKAGLEETIYSFIEKMKEDRDDSKKQYEYCNYDEQCEIWVIPKTTIEALADKATYAVNHGNSSFVRYSDGEIGQVMEFYTADFIKSIKGERLHHFSLNDFKHKSIVYEFGIELHLYNQEDFIVKDNKLFMKKIYLGGIHNGHHYRFGDKITQGHKNVIQIYPLDECKKVIDFFEFDMLFEE